MPKKENRMVAPAKTLTDRQSSQDERKATEKSLCEILEIVRISQEVQEHSRLSSDKNRRIVNSHDLVEEINVMRYAG